MIYIQGDWAGRPSLSNLQPIEGFSSAVNLMLNPKGKLAGPVSTHFT